MRKMFVVCLVMFVVVSLPAMASSAPKQGDTLRIGLQLPKNLDPHLTGNSPEMVINANVYQALTVTDDKGNVLPELATSWRTTDGKVWVFDLDKDARFSDGSPVTPEDIIFNFNRMRDPKVGSTMVKLLSDLEKVEKTGPHQVSMTFGKANPELPRTVAQTQAYIISSKTKNFKRPIGSGYFIISEYYPEERMILERNPYFCGKDENGVQLPYFDTLEVVFANDFAGQTEALVGGLIDFQGGLTPELAGTVKKSSNLKLVTRKSNMHYMMHFRSDGDHVGSNAKLVKALKLATNFEEIARIARPDLAFLGNGTPIGPAFGRYYLDVRPEYNLEKAKQRLAEAGFPDGTGFEVIVQNSQSVVPIATVWREQMAKIGIDVKLKVVPMDVYYGKGDESWLKCDVGITNWGPRSLADLYFKMAYVSDAAWNGSHWSNGDFDQVVRQLASEMDPDQRIALTHEAQRIMMKEGPFMSLLFELTAIGMNKNLEGAFIPTSWSRARFGTAYFAK